MPELAGPALTRTPIGRYLCGAPSAVLIPLIMSAGFAADGQLGLAEPANTASKPVLRAEPDRGFLLPNDSRSWIGFLGPLRLSEKEFFWCAGDLARAERARAHQQWRTSLFCTAWTFILTGAGLWIEGATGDKHPGNITAGQICTIVASAVDVIAICLGKNASTIDAASQAAGLYNSQ